MHPLNPLNSTFYFLGEKCSMARIFNARLMKRPFCDWWIFDKKACTYTHATSIIKPQIDARTDKDRWTHLQSFVQTSPTTNSACHFPSKKHEEFRDPLPDRLRGQLYDRPALRVPRQVIGLHHGLDSVASSPAFIPTSRPTSGRHRSSI